MNNGLLYFAYGSNMSLKQMEKRCPKDSFKVVGAGIANNYILAFTRRSKNWDDMGVADLKKHKGSRTYGVVYKINDRALVALNNREGYRENRPEAENSYNRKQIEIELVKTGKKHRAYCYFANPEDDFIQPSRRYLDTLLTGAGENRLPEEAIENIKRFGKWENVV